MEIFSVSYDTEGVEGHCVKRNGSGFILISTSYLVASFKRRYSSVQATKREICL